MKLGKRFIGLTLACVAITFVGCNPEVGRVISGETVTKSQTVTKVTPVLSVKVNNNGVSGLAVRSAKSARTVIRDEAGISRAAEDDFTLEDEDTLIALMDDGSTESFISEKTTASGDTKYTVTVEVEETVTYKKGNTKIKKKTIEVALTADELREGITLEDGTIIPYEVDEKLGNDVEEMLEMSAENEEPVVMPAVMETYQCRFQDSIDEQARGVYIVYEDCSSNHKNSQLQYVYPDGEIFDIYTYDGNFWYDEGVFGALRSVMRDMKSGSGNGKEAASGGGNEYIQFDKRGNAYIASYDYCGDNEAEKGQVIYKFNPLNKKISKIVISTQTKDTRLNGFAVDDDGTNLFTSEIECELGDNSKDIWDGYSTLNAYRIIDGEAPKKTELYRSSVKEYSAGNPVYFNGKLYCVVNDYDGDEKATGLYIANPDSAANYKKSNVTIQRNITHYTFFERFLKTSYKENGNKWNYQEILDFIFDNYCVAGEKEFRLDRIYSTQAEYDENGKGSLYSSTLTNIDALKYVFEDGTDNAITILNDNGIWDADGNGSEDIFHKFICVAWDNRGRIPLEKFVFKKGSTETAFATSKEYYTTTFGGMNINGFKIIASGDGLFFLNEYNESEQAYKYLELYQICDKSGKFIGEVPPSVNPKAKALFIHPNGNTNTKILDYKDPTTWFKSPIQATEKGIVMMSQDKKTLYYYDNGVANNILINDSASGTIDEILTFDATSKSVFYNAKSGNKYFTKKIDLSDYSVVEVKLDEQLGSIMEYHDSKISTDNYGSSAVFKVTLAANPVIEISTTSTSSQVTLKVTNCTETAGYKVRWECMGNVLSNSDTLVMKKANFAAGSYPVTVVAAKDGEVVSDLLFVEITK